MFRGSIERFFWFFVGSFFVLFLFFGVNGSVYVYFRVVGFGTGRYVFRVVRICRSVDFLVSVGLLVVIIREIFLFSSCCSFCRRVFFYGVRIVVSDDF